ncbi:uncharacterized protein BCR38DRAFT_408135 [Pseudomassariella vexata]|uniref:Uncharacterized protein n=1 Tax=Pseudomassariella vexata TaxID=1141098 RepID=A0A1Y2E3Z4_9PEZI|nr:uncharacterized protein BCR38DRAFT_408135 [Pseudomassariella vexata]ORY66167.1 hypothetical protein BCR38DRAFT_408135 [Pseudomassariella vexata]
MNTWQNLFPAYQLAFGALSPSGKPNDDAFEISVSEDDLSWQGTSALIVALYVPAFFLLLEPRRGTVTFGILSSPATTMAFVSKLGMTVNVYETTLNNSTNVYITRHVPNQTGFPAAPGFAQTERIIPEIINPGADSSLIAGVD